MNTADKKNGIAIIGLACRFPGAETPETFWNLIAEGRQKFEPIPLNRTQTVDFDAVQTRIGSFIENPWIFDNGLFKISPEEAQVMDPQQRIMLELSAEITDFHKNHGSIDSLTGVFIGANQRSYMDHITSVFYRRQILQKIRQFSSLEPMPEALRFAFLQELNTLEYVSSIPAETITGNISNMIAGRISHEFNLKGPSFSVDSACSSSLLAVHLACESLMRHESNMAFAGGVNLNLSPTLFLLMEAADVISKKGKCIPFSEHSDGILLGEGAGLLLLKREEDAIRDKDPILAIIRGSGTNNDGRTLSTMAPGWKGQLSLLESTYSRSGMDASELSLIEAHGTSTRIGDSVEMTVLKKFFNPKTTLSVGSVKSNIGHTLAASGIAGLIKTVLALVHKKLPPTLIEDQPNPKWNLNESRMKLQQSLEFWNSDRIRTAGVSSFGFGGTNVHIILEESDSVAPKLIERNFHQKEHEKYTFDLFQSKPECAAPEGIYQMRWTPYPIHEEKRIELLDRWILLGEKEHPRVRQLISDATKHWIQAFPGKSFTRHETFLYEFNPEKIQHLEWLFESLETAQQYGLIYIPSSNPEECPEITVREILFLKKLLGTIADSKSLSFSLCFSDSAFEVRSSDKISPHQHALTTYFGFALNELNQKKGACIDLPLRELLSFNTMLCQDAAVYRVFRDGMEFRPNLTHVRATTNAPKIKKGAIYWIIGGTSGIGAALSIWLIEQHDAKVVISGTRNREELPESLQMLLGEKLRYERVSVTDADQLEQTAQKIHADLGTIHGVVYAAGALQMGSFRSVEDAEVLKQLELKISGIRNLEKALQSKDPAFVTLLSSASSLSPAWGSGMVTYATANAYLNAFSTFKGERAGVWISGSWGPWKETGMAQNHESKGTGSLGAFDRSTALKLFENSLHHGPHCCILQPEDIVRFNLNKSEKKTAHIAQKEPITRPAQKENSLIGIKRDIQSEITRLIARESGLPPEEIDINSSFADLGVDSIGALDVIVALEKISGRSLNPTLLYEHDSIRKLADFLNSKPKEVPKSYPLLPAQKAFYSQWNFQPDLPCNVLIQLKINELLNHNLLLSAWDKVVSNHQSLRLHFEMSDKGPVQKIQDPGNNIIHHIESGDERLDEIENRYIHKPYKIDGSSLYDLIHFESEGPRSILLFCAHHIITDAWSMTLILKDLLDTYQKLKEGHPDPLVTTRTNFSEYVEFLHSREDPRFEENKQFWQKEISSYNPVTLSENGDRGTSSGYRVLKAILPENDVKNLKKRASEYDLSLFQLLLSAYFQSLEAFSSHQDLIIRVATANRDRSFKDVAQISGCFADSIPIRIQLSSNESLFETGKKVKEKIQKCTRFTPFSSSDISLLPSKYPNDGPKSLSGFGISYINLDSMNRKDQEHDFELECRSAMAFAELSLICLLHEGALHFSWNYQSELLCETEMGLFYALFLQKLLPEVHQHPISLRTAEPLRLPQKTLYPGTPLIHQKIFAACDKFAHKTAIIEEHRVLSYTDLKSRSLQISHTIIQSGHNQTKAIGILGNPGIEACLGILGIMDSGCAYIPLDPEWPWSRTEQIIKHSGISLIVTTFEIWTQFKKGQAANLSVQAVLFTDEEKRFKQKAEGIQVLQLLRRKHVSPLPSNKQSTQSDLAYIMYTSGTTNEPKGVMVTHRSLSSFLSWVSETFQISETDRFIATSSIGFGGSIRQMFSTLLAGAQIHPINRFDFKDPKSLLQFLTQHQITLMNTVPSVLRNLCSFKEEEPDFPISLPHLKWLLIGGEALDTSLVQRWRTQFSSDQQIVNLYGSTETIVNATMHIAGSETEIPIGKAKSGSHVVLINDKGKLCRPYEKGELFVGGPAIAMGYYKAQALSKSKFVRLGIPGTKGTYYKTGDLAIKDTMGNFFYRGRNDDQIQLYGNRIEPLEIERSLVASGLVKNAVVLDQHQEDKQYLIAFVEPFSLESPPSEKELRAYVSGFLPSYMVPHQIRCIRKLPINHAGKIDRKELRKELSKTETTAYLDPFNGETEEIIRGIWKSVLKLESFERTDDFFSLGGDSMMALEVLHQIRKKFKVAPKPIELFRNRTIADLVLLLTELNQVGESSVAAKTKVHSAPLSLKQFPLSASQKGFIYLQRLKPETALNLVASVPVIGPLNTECFTQALEILVQRHPMLRTRFISSGLHTYQMIEENIQINLQIHNRERLPLIKFDEFVSNHCTHMKNWVFNLSQPPLYRIDLILTPDDRTMMVLCLHHIIGDAWSLHILANELLRVYDQLMDGKPVLLGDLSTHYSDFVRLEPSSQSSAEQITKRQEFWKSRFDGLMRPKLIHQTDKDPYQETVVFRLDPDQKEALIRFCAHYGNSLFQLILTLYARAIQTCTGERELLLGVAHSGRDFDLPQIEQIVGCFAGMLPVRISSVGMELKDDLSRVIQAFLDSSIHVDTPPSEMARLWLESGTSDLRDLHRFVLSFMDFSTLPQYHSHYVEIDWENASFHLNTEGAQPEIMLGVRVGDSILLSINGYGGTALKHQIQESMQQAIKKISEGLIKKTIVPIDAALIAYLPSRQTLSSLLPHNGFNHSLSKDFLHLILPNDAPALLEIENTPFGRSGSIFIPLFADEVAHLDQQQLLGHLLKALALAREHGARSISLAGILPAKTQYLYALEEAIRASSLRIQDTFLTTGHACTVVAVVKTIEQVLKTFNMPISNLQIGILGFGSIGQSSLHLLLSKIGRPKHIVIAERKAQISALRKPIEKLRIEHGFSIDIVATDFELPETFYHSNIIIGATSGEPILDINSLKPGSLVVDDSFPHMFSVSDAFKRMKKSKDVLILGGGKLEVGIKNRELLTSNLLASWLPQAIDAMGDSGLPGCRVESLLQSYDSSLLPTKGLVHPEHASIYWDKLTALGVGAVDLHLQGYIIPPSLIHHLNNLLQSQWEK